MKNGIKVKQQDITDCGAASLASICAYYGLRFPVARIRQYAYTDKKGTNILGMVKAAEKLGFSAKGVKAQPEALTMIPLPAIAHVVVNNVLLHFVVIYRVSSSNITYMDPADGEMHKCTIDKFKEIWTGVLVIMEPSDSFHKGKIAKSNFSKFIRLLAPHKYVMLQALFGALICSILGLSTSVYVGKITDYVLVDENLNLLNLMSIAMIIILILQIFIGAMKSILALKTGQRIDASLILGYYKHILRLPQQFFDTMRVGEIISRVNDAVKIRSFINDVFIDLIVNVMVLVITICVMFFYSWKLALVALASGPLFAIIFFAYNKLNKKYLRKIMEKSADLESHLVESLNAIVTVKRFGLEDFANLKTENRFVRLLKNTYSAAYGGILTVGGMEFVSTGITIAVLWIGSYFVINKDFTPGTLMVFYSLIGYILTPMRSLISSNQQLQDANIAADRLFQIMDLESEESEADKMDIESDMIGNIVFDHVAFRYGTRKDIFEDLTLEIPKGKTIAIVGESGSGKTTLISLLQHIYPVNNGSIRIGNYDLAQISNKSLRQCIGTVPQQIELFQGTILENITIGDFHPDMKLVNDLILQLGLDSFINSLPHGLKTQIGEHGASLSGGERQRLAIARALYKKPDILIFDEATSSLDSISERFVKQVLTKLKDEGKTIIIIAHRLSTIKASEQIIVLESGKVVEQGSHEQLLSNKGAYHKLWKEQFEYSN